MQKRNPIKKVYEPYSVHKDWKCPLTTEDMFEQINCASCGVDMIFGDGYTSKQIHTPIGLGYAVCEECYHLERK